MNSGCDHDQRADRDQVVKFDDVVVLHSNAADGGGFPDQALLQRTVNVDIALQRIDPHTQIETGLESPELQYPAGDGVFASALVGGDDFPDLPGGLSALEY